MSAPGPSGPNAPVARAGGGSLSVPSVPDQGSSLWRDAMRRLRRNRLAVGGALYLVLLVLACFVVPWIFGLDPHTQDPKLYDRRPSSEHWFGTDGLGRDYFARVLVGGRISLLVGLAGTIVTVIVGTLYGAIAGYYGGKIDDVMMRFVDFMYGLPYMLLVVLIMLLFKDEDRGPIPIFAALGLVQWLGLSRIVRGQVLSLRNREFVQAARVMGAGDARIVLAHVLPNCLGTIVVYASLMVPAMILLESFLSFLGLGVALSWGNLVAQAAKVVNPTDSHWWLLVAPSAALFTALLSLNFLGDGLRDALDPKTRR